MGGKAPMTEREEPRGAAADRRKLAQKIAERLFTNAMGQRATRLRLFDDPSPRDLGGWCFNAAVAQIEDVLRGER